MEKGDLVRIKTKYQEFGENNSIYEILEDRDSRVLIAPIVWKYAIRPSTVVLTCQIESMIKERV